MNIVDMWSISMQKVPINITLAFYTNLPEERIYVTVNYHSDDINIKYFYN